MMWRPSRSGKTHPTQGTSAGCLGVNRLTIFAVLLQVVRVCCEAFQSKSPDDAAPRKASPVAVSDPGWPWEVVALMGVGFGLLLAAMFRFYRWQGRARECDIYWLGKLAIVRDQMTWPYRHDWRHGRHLIQALAGPYRREARLLSAALEHGIVVNLQDFPAESTIADVDWLVGRLSERRG